MRDLRYALRIFARNPGFTFVAVLALALGIGATTAIFSVVDTVLLKPLPYHDPDQLISIGESGLVAREPDYVDWRARNHVFGEMTAYNLTIPTLTGAGEPVRITGERVTGNFFRTLEVQPMLGRTFNVAEDQPGGPKVVILAHSFWQRHFGGASDVLGKSLTLDGAPYTVIGVLPSTYRHPDSSRPELVLPFALDSAGDAARGITRFFPVLGRLRPGVTLAQARAEIGAFFAQSKQPGLKLSLVPLHDRQVANVRLAMLALLGAVACVLLIACANVANLLLSRAAGRQKEIAVRASLGAGRNRLVRQLLTESALLGFAGGAAGLLLAAATLKSIIHLAPPLPRIDDVTIDVRVLGFTLLLSLVVSFVFGLTPALGASRVDLSNALKQGAAFTRHRAIRSVLVVAELALSMVLLVGAGLLIQTLWRLQHVNTGISAERVLTTDISLNYKQYSQALQRRAFFSTLIDRVSGQPGVVAAGMTSALPPYRAMVNNLKGPGPAAPINVCFNNVTPGYFAALGIPLRRGRSFTNKDTDAAVINEALARHYFPNEDPIGKRLSTTSQEWTVIGVVADVKNDGLVEPASPEVFLPNQGGDFNFLVIRAIGEPTALAGAVREQVRSLDKSIPLTFRTMTEELDDLVSSERFNSILLSVFAGMALLLAAIGIYGVMSYLVTRRTQEIGIRMALGARTGNVLALVIGHALRLTLAGVVIGAGLALGLTRYLASLLYGVTATDALTFSSVAFLLIAVALAASYIPALRAARLDPVSALRCE